MDVEGDVEVDLTDEISMSFHKSSDFIWAIQITKIWKPVFSSNWIRKTYVKGALFGVNDEEEQLENILSEENVEEVSILLEGDEVFVVPDVQLKARELFS